jgi:hypothetical protein
VTKAAPLAKRGRRSATAAEAQRSRVKAERIETIAEHRRKLEWTHALATELRAAWGIKRKAMEELAAEAGRVVYREVTDREAVTADVGVTMRQILRFGKNRDRVAAGNVWAKLAGAMAPEQHIHGEIEPVLLSSDWKRVYSVVIEALRPYPDAARAVVAALENLDGPRG